VIGYGSRQWSDPIPFVYSYTSTRFFLYKRTRRPPVFFHGAAAGVACEMKWKIETYCFHLGRSQDAWPTVLAPFVNSDGQWFSTVLAGSHWSDDAHVASSVLVSISEESSATTCPFWSFHPKMGSWHAVNFVESSSPGEATWTPLRLRNRAR
jgi:hypothetical protein